MERERLRVAPFAALAALSAALTAWLLASSRIPWSADQAVVALMARHILAGRGHPVFYWGSTYGGTLEPHLVAAAFAVFGPTPAVYRGVLAALYVLLLAGTTLFTGRFFGRKASFGAALFLAIPPFFLPYKALTSDGAYASVALLGLATAWLALAADERLSTGRRARWSFFGLGLAAGLGLWVTPATLPVAGVAFLWVVLRPAPRPRVLALVAYAFGGVAGGLPWWIWNLRHGWASVKARELAPVAGRGLLANASRFLTDTLPVFLGAARPNFSGDPHASFLLARAVVPLLVLALVLPAVVAARRDRRLRLLLLVLVVLSAGAATSGRLAPSEPRFLIAGYAPLAALLGVSFAKLEARNARFLFTAGLGALLASNVSSAFQAHRHLRDTNDSQVTGPLGPLMAELRSKGITRVWTNYWTAYRLTFESGEGIVAAPIPREDTDRYAPIQDVVRTAPDPAVVLLPPRDDCFRRYLAESGEPFAEARSDSFAIFLALPAPTRDLVRAAGALPMPSAAYRPAWSATDLPARLEPGEDVRSHARVTNEGPCTWMNNVRLVAEWAGPETREDFFATPDRRVLPGESADLSFRLRAPTTPGVYALRLDLDQEGIARFSAKGGATHDARVSVER